MISLPKIICKSLFCTTLLVSICRAEAQLPAAAENQQQLQEFTQCKARLQLQARAEGLPQKVIDDVLNRVQLVPRVIELDRSQPEFTRTFAGYFNRRVTDTRVEQGRAALERHGPLLRRLTLRYGVPPQYIVAFWGLETNYGSYLGKMPVLDSLATLACDKRRSTFFSSELFEALRLLDTPGVDQPLLGSWAGAMGNTQFMPSAYRRYAVDGDGDGRIDLWRSIPDALTSAANFLQQLGWQRGLRWGREVKLPAGFDYARAGAGAGQRQPLSYWQELGVTTADGQPLPQAAVDALLLVPAGHEGPAFLVYNNFDVIMRWNRSEYYALSVGHLADRINGGGKLIQPPPAGLDQISVDSVRLLQEGLNSAGFDAGNPDGILGPGTRQAIRQLQQSRGMIADGYPHAEVFEAFGIAI